MKTNLLLCAISVSVSLSAAPFQNLGFDNLNFPDWLPAPIPGAPISSVVQEWMTPGWVLSSAVGYNWTQPFESRASLLDMSYRNTWQPANPVKAPVVGSYSLGIWPNSGIAAPPFFLGQTGDIPGDAHSLRFLYQGDNLSVTVAGVEQPLHLVQEMSSGDPDILPLRYYAVDVSAAAGTTALVAFEFRSFGNPPIDGPPIPGLPDAKFHVLDDLSFSPLPAVPEPATWILAVVGGVAGLVGCRRRWP